MQFRMLGVLFALCFVSASVSLAGAPPSAQEGARAAPSLPEASVARSGGKRLALVIGNGDYKFGLSGIFSSKNDAFLIKRALESPGVDFNVTLLTGSDLKDLLAFQSALTEFANKVDENDEVIFYFSGYAFDLKDRGVFFLLLDAKSYFQYLGDLPAADRRSLAGR